MYLSCIQMYKKLDNDTLLGYTVLEIEENVIGKTDEESKVVDESVD